MPCMVATGSWGTQLSTVTKSDSSASLSSLRMALRAPTCHPSLRHSRGDACALGAGGHF